MAVKSTSVVRHTWMWLLPLHSSTATVLQVVENQPRNRALRVFRFCCRITISILMIITSLVTTVVFVTYSSSKYLWFSSFDKYRAVLTAAQPRSWVGLLLCYFRRHHRAMTSTNVLERDPHELLTTTTTTSCQNVVASSTPTVTMTCTQVVHSLYLKSFPVHE